MNKSLALFFLIMLSVFVYGQDSNHLARTALEEAVKRSDIYSASDVEGFMFSIETIESRKGNEIERNQLRAKVLKDAQISKLMVRYTEPSAIKGTTYLVYMDMQKKIPEGIWVYLPSFKKTQGISPLKAKKSLPKAITSLSIFNAREIDFDDYTFSKSQEGTKEKESDLIIAMEAKRKNTKNHLRVWIEKERGLISKVIKKDIEDREIEKIEFHAYKPYGAYWLPSEISTHDFSTEKTIKVVLRQVELNAALKTSDFELKEIENPF